MYPQCESLRGHKKKSVTLVNSETLARNRTLISGENARALIDLIVTFLTTFILLVSGTIAVSCGLSTGAFA
jgi:hypothetical protein